MTGLEWLVFFLQLPLWPLRALARAMGISPDLVVTFDDPPFDNADESAAVFLMLPVTVRRQRWRGDTKPIEHCTVRLRFRGEIEDARQGVWYDYPAPHHCKTETTLFEGYTRFDIPILIQHIRDSYWHAGTPSGTYLADVPFMYEHLIGGMRLKPGLFWLGVDVIAGRKILAASDWIIAVTNAPSIYIERAWTDLSTVQDAKPLLFRPTPEKEETSP